MFKNSCQICFHTFVLLAQSNQKVTWLIVTHKKLISEHSQKASWASFRSFWFHFEYFTENHIMTKLYHINSSWYFSSFNRSQRKGDRHFTFLSVPKEWTSGPLMHKCIVSYSLCGLIPLEKPVLLSEAMENRRAVIRIHIQILSRVWSNKVNFAFWYSGLDRCYRFTSKIMLSQ